jgi:dTDP-4-amino-4,6-dideoxygalactose transaminase
MDRRWQMTDMSSQSMAQMLSSNVATMADQRRRNQRFLNENFPVGQPLIAFRPDEVPLLQNVLLPDQKTRDDLRAFLATRGVFCSIHWPLHPLLRQLADDVDCTDAAWLEDHVLSIPIADDFDESRMAAICEAATEWRKAGG